VTSRASRAAAEALRACARIQRSHVDAVSGVRTGILVTVIILVALPGGRIDAATSVAIGALFIAIVDVPDTPSVRLRSMLWGTLWIGLGVLVGGLVSDFGAVHVVVAIVLAGACGYAGSLGPRSGLVGVLTLVLFAVYAGDFVGAETAVENMLYFALGGALTIILNLSAVPLRRMTTVRTSIARAYRELEAATSRRGLDLAAPSVAAEIMSSRAIVQRLGCSGESQQWASALISDAERTRIALLALASQGDRAPELLTSLAVQAGRLCGTIAHALGRPWGGPRRRVSARATDQLAALESLLASTSDERLARLGRELVQPLRDAVASLDHSWPIGPRASITPPHQVRAPVMGRLRAHAHLDDPVTEHALRLMVAFGGATLAAVLVGVSHAYWLPLTVAWVAKPDLSSTVTRVTMRVAGTIAGLLISSALLFAVSDAPGAPQILALVIGLASILALAYLWANYPIAVIGITVFVIVAEYLAGDGEGYDLIARLTATVIAGLWVLLIASLRPRRTGASALARLRETLTALRDYSCAVRTGEGVDAARLAVLQTRSAALAAVTAASLETPGLWERTSARIDPEQAAVVLTDIIDAASAILAEELLTRQDSGDASIWVHIDDDLDDLESRITALAAVT